MCDPPDRLNQLNADTSLRPCGLPGRSPAPASSNLTLRTERLAHNCASAWRSRLGCPAWPRRRQWLVDFFQPHIAKRCMWGNLRSRSSATRWRGLLEVPRAIRAWRSTMWANWGTQFAC